MDEFPVDDVAGVVWEEVTMFDVVDDVELNGVVTLAEVVALPVLLLFEAVPEEVEEAEVRLVVAAPIEKSDVAEKTSEILPMLTASNV